MTSAHKPEVNNQPPRQAPKPPEADHDQGGTGEKGGQRDESRRDNPGAWEKPGQHHDSP